MIVPETIENAKSPEDFWKLYGLSYWPPNTVNKWMPSDTEEAFDKNMSNKKTRKLLIEGKWNKDSITYRFNNYGFRTDDDFDIENPSLGNMFLGCSFTDGIGLNIEDVWSYKLNQKLGGTFYNLGQGGTGLDTQYRLFKAWAPVLKPKRAFTLGAYEPRREFIKGDIALRINSWFEDSMLFFEKYLSCDNELIIHYKRTLDAIKLIAIENDIELYVLTEEINNKAKELAKADIWARDLIHYGPMYHDYIVDNFKSWQRLV